MTVQQLRRLLSYLPDDAEAVIAGADRAGEGVYLSVSLVSLIRMRRTNARTEIRGEFARFDPSDETADDDVQQTALIGTGGVRAHLQNMADDGVSEDTADGSSSDAAQESTE